MSSGWRAYWSYWLLITVSLVFFVKVSPFLPEKWERIMLPEMEEPAMPSGSQTLITIKIPPPIRREQKSSKKQTTEEIEKDTSTSSERILLIGDSMIEWLCRRLASWCKAQGYQLYTVIWPSSGIMWWGRSDTLRRFIEAHRPTYILISLGSNELLVPGVKTLEPYLERIFEQVGDIPVVWIGPPAWTKDKGLIRMLKERMGPGRYLSSERLIMERASDGAHPIPSEAYRWADTLVSYLRDSALYPLAFSQSPPPQLTTIPHRTYLLKPHAP
ncbi:MAG: hypothetical protein RML92_06920 [Bacteroidia bacterium]|nr:hypothetical protein [Bacteroidia bacterium]